MSNDPAEMSGGANYDRATELVQEIGSLIVAEQTRDDDGWDAIAVTSIVAGGSVQISGYRYANGDKPRPAGVESGTLADKFEELCNAMQNADGGKWKAALVQIRRDTGKITINYAYSDPMRWKVTPANIATLPEEMRPK